MAQQFDSYTSAPAPNQTRDLVRDAATRFLLASATEGSIQDPPVDFWGRTSGGSTLVPPGEYVLGDPCYALPNKFWVRSFDFSWPERVFIGKLPAGDRVIALHTDHGDGAYAEVGGTQIYGVDSGLIGLVPLHVAQQRPDHPRGSSRVVQYSRTTQCGAYGPYLKFGNTVIHTGW